jgi:hypothetical protein
MSPLYAHTGGETPGMPNLRGRWRVASASREEHTIDVEEEAR